MGIIGRKGAAKPEGEAVPFRKTGLLTRCSVHDVEEMLAEHYGVRQNLIVPNVGWGFFQEHEADLVVVTKAGYLTEIEIKRSWTDFLADFEKRSYHDDPRISRLFYAVPECMYGPCREYVDALVGEGSPLVGKRIPGFIVYRTPSDSKYRRVVEHDSFSRPVPVKPQKLTAEEVYQLARLGTLRYWSLLGKLRVAERRYEEARGGAEVIRLKNLLAEVKADYREATGETWKFNG